MSPELQQLLRSLAADPGRFTALDPEQEQQLLASLRAAIAEEPTPSRPQVALAAAGTECDLLTVDEAAALLRVSPRWLYRHAKNLPFARKLSPKVLRFSRVGIARYLATRRP